MVRCEVVHAMFLCFVIEAEDLSINGYSTIDGTSGR